MKKLILLAAMALASVSFGKGFSQEWTSPFPAWESVVYSCDKPEPYRLAAMDDFSLVYDSNLNNINWWGVVSDPAQVYRPYYIAIIQATDKCQPSVAGRLLWSACIKPYNADHVGNDCQGKQVWRFQSLVPAWNPLNLRAGQYWIQISESNLDSVRPNDVDFWWSGRRPDVQCPALQKDAFGNILQPLVDMCTGKPNDLSFDIF